MNTKKIKILLLFVFLSVSNIYQLTAQNKITILQKQLQETKDKIERIKILTDIAEYYLPDSSKKALNYSNEALKALPGLFGTVFKRNNIPSDIQAKVYRVAAEANYYENNYKTALQNYEKEYKIIEKQGSSETIMKAAFNIAALSRRLQKNKESAEFYEKALQLAEKSNDLHVKRQIYQALAEVYSDMNKHNEALKYFRLYMKMEGQAREQKIKILNSQYHTIKKEKDETVSELNEKKQELNIAEKREKQLAEDTTQKAHKIEELHVETKEKDQVIEKKEEEVAKQRRLIFTLLAFFIIIAVFSFLVYWQFRQKKQAYKQLERQNKEIIAQKMQIVQHRDKITKQNEEITASIRYAKRIQQAVLPKKELTDQVLQEFFIFFAPRDIVSGDYYWITKIKNKTIIAVADCTGHGVPGAFMSMLGVAFLNEIVNKQNLTEPDAILNQLREQVIESLQQQGKKHEAKDGMDIVIVTIDREAGELQYSGANSPIYLIRKTKEGTDSTDAYSLTQIKGDKMPVSIYIKMRPFSKHVLDVKKNDSIYMFSDGYADQFGGEKGKKFKYKSFKDLLLSIQDKKMQEQKNVLEETFKKWKGDYAQVDDILVIGIKI